MKNIGVFILSALWFMGCTDADYITILTRSERLMTEAPDSVLTILNPVSLSDIRAPVLRAKYALLYSQALDKNYIDVDNDSLIRVAVDYFRHHGSFLDKAKAYYYYGVVHYNASDIESAMRSFVQASIYVEKTDDHNLKGLIYTTIGNLYYDQYSYDEAVKMYSKAIDAFIAIDNKNNLLIAMHSKGLSLAFLDQFEDAAEVLTRARELAVEQNDTATMLDIITSVGFLSIKMDRDVPYFTRYKEDLFATYKKYTNNVVPQKHYPILGAIYYIEDKIDSARYYCQSYLDGDPDINVSNVGFYTILSSIESSSNNYKKAFEYECYYSKCMDSIGSVQKDHLIQNLEKKYKTEYLQKSYETLQIKHRYEILFLILLIALALLAVCAMVYYYKLDIERKNQQIAESERYLDEVRYHQIELEEKYTSITTNANLQDEKSQALFEILGNRIRSLQQILEWASKYEKNTDAFYNQVKEHIRLASGKNRELAEDVIAIANLSCHGIIDHLTTLYPTLSQHELSYCGFICLGFSPESIRILYNHTNIYSIYPMRSKIRNKLGVTNSSNNLETYILSLMKKLETEELA